MIWFQLFLSFLQVGMFSVGGGYAAMPLIQNQVVTQHSWLTMAEFTDLVTIAEMTPGPIAVNAATFVGNRIAGIPGAIVATFSCILPSLIIVSLLAYIYRRCGDLPVLQGILKFLRTAVVALIASAGISILIEVATVSGVIGVALFLAAFVAIRRFKINPILTMCLCGAANLIVSLLPI